MMKSIYRGGLKTKRENKRESTVAMEKIKVEHNFSNTESIFILFEIWRAPALKLAYLSGRHRSPVPAPNQKTLAISCGGEGSEITKDEPGKDCIHETPEGKAKADFS